MKRCPQIMIRTVAGLLWMNAVVARAQPYINGRGITNGASYMSNSLAGGGIAQGSIFSLFGTDLGPQQGVQVSAFPIQTSLAGVSVSVTQGKSVVAALPIYVSATQVNAIMPSNTPPGRVAVTVSYDNSVSNPSPVTVVSSAFGIFTANSAGFGPGILTNFVTSANQPTNALSMGAKPGQVVTIWGTGLGAVAADNVAPTAGNLAAQTAVFVGGVLVSATYHGRSPCCAGLDQVVFTVPSNVPLGCYVPVAVRTGGITVSNTVTMAIAGSGSTCADPANVIEAPMIAGKAVGMVLPYRVDQDVDVIVPTPSDVTGDFLETILLQPSTSPYFFFPLAAQPPQGACTVYYVNGNLFHGTHLPGLVNGGQFLDGGVPSASGTAAVTSVSSSFYDILLGSNDTTIVTSPLVFSPPNPVTVSMPGGQDVRSFSISIPTTGSVTWTNRDSLASTLDHTQPLTVTWSSTGATNGTVLIGGGNFDTPHNASSMFLCAANVSAGSFTVPVWALANVPATPIAETQPYGNVFIEALGAPVSFSAPGLDAGFGWYGQQFVNAVLWQ